MKKPSLVHLTFASLIAFLVAFGSIGSFIWFSTREPKLGGDFTLNHQGRDWVFSKNALKLNLLYFGYVKCPDVCPLSLSHSAKAFHQLSEKELKQTQLIFLSVDAAHDTAQGVDDYAKQFSPQFVGLSGTDAQIKKTVAQFGASFVVENAPKSYLGYSILHTDRLFFLNQKGEVIDSVPNPRSADEIVAKIRAHL